MTIVLAPVSLDLIAELVCLAYGIRARHLSGRRNTKLLVNARHMAWTLGRHLTGHSHKEIGRFMGGFGHDTVIKAVKDMEVRAEQDAEAAAIFALLTAMAEEIAKQEDAGIEATAAAIVHDWRLMTPKTKAALGASFVAALNSLQTIIERH